MSRDLRITLKSILEKTGALSGLLDHEADDLVAAIDDATRFRIPRLPWSAHFMLEAAVAATRSTCDRGPELLLDPGRHGVGAVFVRNNRVVAGGYNGSPPGQPHCDRFECPECEAEFLESDLLSDDLTVEDLADGVVCPDCQTTLRGGHVFRNGSCVRTLHAEENALIQCALDGVSPKGVTVYTTASPCWDCSKRLVRVGIAKVVFGAAYESRYGLSSDAESLLKDAGIAVNHLDLRDHLRLGVNSERIG